MKIRDIIMAIRTRIRLQKASLILLAIAIIGYLHGAYGTFGGYVIVHRIVVGFELLLSFIVVLGFKHSPARALVFFVGSQVVYYVAASFGEAMYFSPKGVEIWEYFVSGLTNQL